MSHFKTLALSLGAAILVAGCGGNNRVDFSSMVSFGDSLSDVGTYKVGTVAQLGGGLYTVNGISGAIGAEPTPSKNWTELIAARIGQAAPCPAQTGLNSSAPVGTAVAVTNNLNCFNYAQGGARVTNPVGPGSDKPPVSSPLGQLTVPVVTQIDNHLAKLVGNKFGGGELVTVAAGANDVFMNLASIKFLTSAAGGNLTPQQAATAAVTAMGTAGAELAGYVKSKIINNGAQYVVVVNIPDISKTPFGNSQDAATQGLITQMVTTFNTQLHTGLSGTNVRLVDAYAELGKQVIDMDFYSLKNVTTPACNLNYPDNGLADPTEPNSGTSLVCNTSNVIPGDTSRYLFADSVHPSPYGYKLFADLVGTELTRAGWL